MSPHEHFKLVFQGSLEGEYQFRKYVSTDTGITVYLADIPGPLVHGSIVIGTEAHDDDGLPHTLEHLIFLGSEDYPYKGVLDLVANRCMASGTNAWTGLDATGYTVSTAGSDGFFRFLPLFLDHILYPTLQESGYITEVHHVNGKGEDGGVVYCEMQGVENSGETLVDTAFMKTIYSSDCGYSSNTGGALKNLQESTTYEKVKHYHKSFYRPENMAIIVAGKLDLESTQLFDVLKPIEEKIKSKNKLEDFVRPWRTPISPLLESTEKQIVFPSEDEDNGIVKIGWRAPPREDTKTIVALKVLMLYLCDTSISILQKEFVENDDPLCSEVDGEDEMITHGFFSFNFDNVPVKHLSNVKNKLLDILLKISKGAIEIDEKQLKFTIQRRIWSCYSKMESKPNQELVKIFAVDFVYGSGNEAFKRQISTIDILKSMLNESLDITWWQDLTKHYLLESFHVAIIASPSRKEKERLAENEKIRVENQRQRFGEAGLKNLEEALEKAIKKNEILPPDDLVTGYSAPNIDHIQFLHHNHFSNFYEYNPNNARLEALFPLKNLPYRMFIDDCHSTFATIYGIMNTSCIPQHQKLFLPLLLELFLESPILRNGELVPHEQVTKELSRDTIFYTTSFGTGETERYVCGPNAQMAILNLQVMGHMYVEGATWLHDLLFNTVITPERVKIVATKMLNEVAGLKRNGYFVVKTIANEQSFCRESNYRVNSLSRQQSFLKLLLKKLDEDSKSIVAALEDTKAGLTSFANLTVHIMVNLERLAIDLKGDLNVIWKAKYPGDQPRSSGRVFWNPNTVADLKLQPLIVNHCYELRTNLNDKNKCINTALVGLGSIESNFLILTAPCFTDLTHPDLPALMVYLQYMDQLEGPLWKQLRGSGLAYGHSINVDPSKGLLTSLLYRCTDILAAFIEFESILKSYLNGTNNWDESLLESARSSLIFSLVNKVSSFRKVSFESMKIYFNSLDESYLSEFLKSVSSVSFEDVKAAGLKYLPTLFDSSSSCLSICCSLSKVEEIQKNFSEQSRKLQIYTLDDSFIDDLSDNEKNIFN